MQGLARIAISLPRAPHPLCIARFIADGADRPLEVSWSLATILRKLRAIYASKI